MSNQSDYGNIGGIPSEVFHSLPDGVRLYIHELESRLRDTETELKKIKEDRLVLFLGAALTGLSANPLVVSDIGEIPVSGIARNATQLAIECLAEHEKTS